MAHDASGGALLPLQPRSSSGAYPSPSPSAGVRMKRYLGMLTRHRWAALAMAAAILGITVYKVRTATPMYSAVATVRIADDRGSAAIGGVEGAMMRQVLGGKSNSVLTDVQLLKSRPVLVEVVDSAGYQLQPIARALPAELLTGVRVAPDAAARTLHLQFDADGYRVRDGASEVRAAYGMPVSLPGVQFAVSSPPAAAAADLAVLSQDAAAGALKYALSARPIPNTEILQLEVSSEDPVLAERAANAAANVYRAFDAAKARRQAEKRRRFTEEQMHYLESLQRRAQQELGDFRAKQRTYSSKAEFEAIQGSVFQLQTERDNLNSDRNMYNALLTTLKQGSSAISAQELQTLLSTPGVAGSPVVSQLFTQLIQFQTTRDTLVSGRWGRATTNPDVQKQDVLIHNTQSRLVAAIESLVASLGARVATLDQVIAQKGNDVPSLTGPEAEELRLLQQVELLGTMAVKMGQEYQQARIAEAVEDGHVEIVEYADRGAPVGMSNAVKLTIGAILALLGAFGFAFVLENLSTSITRREELTETLNLPDLALIPQIPTGPRLGRGIRLPGRVLGGGSRFVNQELVMTKALHSPGAEAYRELRTRLIYSGQVGAKQIVVTSARPGEGKSTTAANLAITFAYQGLRVLLVDCDMRRPRLHRVFHLESDAGLVEVVNGSRVLEEVIQPTAVDGLFVLASGRATANPSELLGGRAMQDVLDTVADRFDIAIFDTPPVLAVSDAAVLATRTDGVVFVVKAGQTDREEAQLAVQKLTSVGARLIGAVLNDPDARAPHLPHYYAYASQTA